MSEWKTFSEPSFRGALTSLAADQLLNNFCCRLKRPAHPCSALQGLLPRDFRTTLLGRIPDVPVLFLLERKEAPSDLLVASLDGMTPPIPNPTPSFVLDHNSSTFQVKTRNGRGPHPKHQEAVLLPAPAQRGTQRGWVVGGEGEKSSSGDRSAAISEVSKVR